MFIKSNSINSVSPMSYVNCEGGGACTVGSSTDCKNITGAAKNEGKHNYQTQQAMSNSK